MSILKKINQELNLGFEYPTDNFMVLIPSNTIHSDYATLERIHVTYFDEAGIEHNTKIMIGSKDFEDLTETYYKDIFKM